MAFKASKDQGSKIIEYIRNSFIAAVGFYFLLMILSALDTWAIQAIRPESPFYSPIVPILNAAKTAFDWIQLAL